MNLVRLVFIAIAVWLAIYVLRRVLHYLSPPDTPSTGAANNMVRCAECGLHLPESEAIAYQGKHFCCQEHRREYFDSH